MKKKILVSDDDPGVQDIFRIIFEKAGYDVQIKQDANDILRNDFENPNVFLLDKQLSGIDGLDVCKYLKSREETRHIPVIMISASPGLQSVAESAGADDYLEKPFHKKALLEIVAKHIGV